jgi:hypothetical protein
MKFVLVNDRALKNGYCAMCCEAIRAEYLRDLETRFGYCDHHCYSVHCESLGNTIRRAS